MATTSWAAEAPDIARAGRRNAFLGNFERFGDVGATVGGSGPREPGANVGSGATLVGNPGVAVPQLGH